MVVAEIGLNHLGKERLLKKYIFFLNKSKVDAVTIQIIKKDFFIENNIPSFYIEKEKIYKIIFKFCKKKIGLIIDNLDKDIYKYKNKISFFKILGDQVKNKNLIESLCKYKKPIYISNKNTNNKEKKYLNYLSKKNKLISLIHTQNKDKTQLKFSNLYNINNILKVTKKRPAFGLHCNDFNVLKYACLFKPKDIFFYIKDDNKKGEYPDNLHAIKLKNLNSVISEINYIDKSIKFWK